MKTMFKEDALEFLEKIHHDEKVNDYGVTHVIGEGNMGMLYAEDKCPHCNLRKWLEDVTIVVD